MPDLKFDFRSTLAYVTDPAGCDPVLGEAYPHTFPSGVVAGWSGAAISKGNRSVAVDPRFAGINFVSNNGTPDISVFQVDLPNSGKWVIRVAVGDAISGHSHMGFSFWDNTNLIVRPLSDGGTVASNNYDDATAVIRSSDADWLANNVAVTYTFTTTTFFLKLGGTAVTDTSLVVHLWLHQDSTARGEVPALFAGAPALKGPQGLPAQTFRAQGSTKLPPGPTPPGLVRYLSDSPLPVLTGPMGMAAQAQLAMGSTTNAKQPTPTQIGGDIDRHYLMFYPLRG